MKRPHVWIIDDDPTDSYVIKTMLEVNELVEEVKVFSSNREFLSSLKDTVNNTNPIHIITENKTDFVNGWKLMEELCDDVKQKNFKLHMSCKRYDNRDLDKYKSSTSLQTFHKKPLRLDDLQQMLRG